VFGTLDAVGDAWSWLVLREAILYDVRRFDEFQRRLGIARSTLAARLGQLIAGGLLERGRRPGSAATDYQLTEPGRAFFACLMTAMRWGDRWCSGGRARPQVATHAGCGRPLDAVLRCSECHEVLRAREVRWATAPLADPTPGTIQRQRSPGYDLLERERPCSIARTLTVMGDWWTGLVIRESFFRTRRFDEFQRRLGTAPNILSGRLTRLVEHGILTRVQYQDRPVRHEYLLTEKGLDLYHVPLAMLTWGDRWLAPEGAPIRLTHRSCDSEFRAVLSCAGCGAATGRGDVILGI
jgi:DNA-binding HxlR family transcriptional regulator